MPKQKRWSELSEGTRRLISVAAVIEGVLKIMALVDLRRRSADDIRGSKRRWASAILFINAGGAVPIAYFLYGRRAKGRVSQGAS